MITATVKHNDNYADIEFPCSEAYLSAKLMEIHVDDLKILLIDADIFPFHCADFSYTKSGIETQ